MDDSISVFHIPSGGQTVARLGMIGFAIFMLAGFKSCSEMQYYMGKRDATARVTAIKENTARGGRHIGWTVVYHFHNDETNEQQKGYSHMSDVEASQFSEGQEIPIEYCGATQIDSRIKGENNRTWVYIFLGSLAFTVGAVAILSWQSMREEKRDRRR